VALHEVGALGKDDVELVLVLIEGNEDGGALATGFRQDTRLICLEALSNILDDVSFDHVSIIAEIGV
jgi:hypothetical protein